MPLYVTVNQDVTSETYIVSDDPNKLTPANDIFTADEVMFMTLTFDSASDEFYTGRTANWDDPLIPES